MREDRGAAPRTSGSEAVASNQGEEKTMTYTLTEVRGPVGIVVLDNPARRMR